MNDAGKTKEELSREVPKPGRRVASLEEIQRQGDGQRCLRAAGHSNCLELLDCLPQPVFETDNKCCFTFANQSALRLFGYSLDELTGGLHAGIVFAPGDRAKVDRNMARALQGEKLQDQAYLLLKQDGTTFPANVHVIPVIHDKEVVGVTLLMEDSPGNTTESGLKEIELKRKMEEQSLLLDNIETLVWYLRDVETYGAVNQALADFCGARKEDLEGKSVYEILHREEADVCVAGNVQVFETRQQIQTEEWVGNCEGERRLLAITKTPKLDELGNVEFVVCSGVDITEQKRAEDLAVTQRDLSIALGATSDLGQALAVCVDSALRVSAMDAAGIYLVNGDLSFDLVAHKGVSDSFAGEVSRLPADSPQAGMILAGKAIYSLDDIPENSRSLLFREKLMTVGITPIFSGARLIGSLHVGSRTLDRVSVQARSALEAIAAKMGSAIVRIRAEEALRESQRRLDLAVEAARLGLWDTDLVTCKVVINRRLAEMLGYRIDELQQMWSEWARLLHPQDTHRVIQALEDHIQGSTPFYEVEHRLRASNGEWRWVLSRGRVVERDQQGEPLRALGTALDVTERKEAQQALQQAHDELERRVEKRTKELRKEIEERKRVETALRSSENRYRTLIDTMNEGFAVLDENAVITYVNRKFAEIVGYEPEELGGFPATALLDEVNRGIFRTNFAMREKGEVRGAYEIAILRRDGENVPVLMSATRLTDERGNFKGSSAVFSDISELKKAEKQIRASLKEKEALLREVHHRVKNNLQVMSSLLKLQAHYIKDERQLGVLKDVEARIRSMAIVHEHLYRSESLERLDMSHYIQVLVRHLSGSTPRGKAGVTVATDVEKIAFGVETAVPVGFIITELVNNCLQHAFPGEREGAVNVSLRKTPGNQFLLAVRDNGVGLPPHIDIGNSQSLGLRLVNLFVDQLSGEYRIDRVRGTAIEIIFKVLSLRKEVPDGIAEHSRRGR